MEWFIACASFHYDDLFTGLALYNISFSYEKNGSLPRALERAREALRIWQASLPPGHEEVALAQSQVRRLERALK